MQHTAAQQWAWLILHATRPEERSTYSSVFGLASSGIIILPLESLECARYSRPTTLLSMSPAPGDDPLRTQSIKRVEVTKGMRTLGVRLAPDGNDFDEFKHWMEEVAPP
jgi:hypothetical protein